MTVVAPARAEGAKRNRPAATLPGFDGIMQVAVITPDARAMIEAIGPALAAGSFKCATLTQPALFDTVFRGAPGDGAMKVGITWIGDMLIEVIEPIGKANVYADYLACRSGKPGVQHIYLQQHGITYEEAIAQFERAGFPPTQHGRLNASGRIGFITVPPMPAKMAEKHATRFCYTSSQDELKLDMELAHFAFGVSYRAGLRIAAADEWLPARGPHLFEQAPRDGFLRTIDTIYVLGRDIEKLAGAYGRLTDHAPDIEPFAGEPLPGAGRVARIECGAMAIVLVEPHAGPLFDLLGAQGEGPHLLGAPARGAKIESRMAERGWSTTRSSGGVFATHAAVPFALWVTPNDR